MTSASEFSKRPAIPIEIYAYPSLTMSPDVRAPNHSLSCAEIFSALGSNVWLETSQEDSLESSYSASCAINFHSRSLVTRLAKVNEHIVSLY